MKVPLRWLQDYIDLPTSDPADLAGVFTSLGHEVEGIEVLEPDWTDVVVGKVLEVAPHPGADRVRVTQVDTGSGPTQIICGAWNFDAGAFVPVARPGAVLPGDFRIGERTIRGVTSHGMICSERELGLGDEARQAYTRAADLYPLAQSPRLALSALAMSRGDRAGALSTIQPVLSRDEAQTADDPWWSYYTSQARAAEGIVNALYQIIRAESP